MADQDGVAQVERLADLEHILGVSVQRRVAALVVRGEIGLARSDVVEQDDPVTILERRRDQPPHVLIAPESVCEQHRLRPRAEHANVVSSDYVDRHAHLPRRTMQESDAPGADTLWHDETRRRFSLPRNPLLYVLAPGGR